MEKTLPAESVEIETDVPTPLDRLKKAKKHSDNKQYSQKNAIIMELFRERIGEFHRDSDHTETGHKKYVGVTHKPTGFQVHVPRTLADKHGVNKEATNRWTKEYPKLSRQSRKKLWYADLHDYRSYNRADEPSRSLLGKTRYSYQSPSWSPPLQISGVPLEERTRLTQVANRDLMDFEPSKNPNTLHKKTPSVATGPMYHMDTNTVVTPHEKALSVLSKDRLRRHEMGHVESVLKGAWNRGHYGLGDRLLAHRLDKKAPGLLLKNRNMTAGMMLEEATAEAHAARQKLQGGMRAASPLAPGSIGDKQLKDVVKHLKVNYRASNSPKSLLGLAPAVGQALMLDPINKAMLKSKPSLPMGIPKPKLGWVRGLLKAKRLFGK